MMIALKARGFQYSNTIEEEFNVEVLYGGLRNGRQASISDGGRTLT